MCFQDFRDSWLIMSCVFRISGIVDWLCHAYWNIILCWYFLLWYLVSSFKFFQSQQLVHLVKIVLPVQGRSEALLIHLDTGRAGRFVFLDQFLLKFQVCSHAWKSHNLWILRCPPYKKIIYYLSLILTSSLVVYWYKVKNISVLMTLWTGKWNAKVKTKVLCIATSFLPADEATV